MNDECTVLLNYFLNIESLNSEGSNYFDSHFQSRPMMNFPSYFLDVEGNDSIYMDSMGYFDRLLKTRTKEIKPKTEYCFNFSVNTTQDGF